MTKTFALTLAASICTLSAFQIQAAPDPSQAAVGDSKAATAALPRTTSPNGAGVYIISPPNHGSVRHTFSVRFGLKGMGIAPAGVDKPNTGHHHLLIDIDQLPPLDLPLAASDKLIHFGGGQTETTLTLAPGWHTLQLMLADKNHVPFNPPLISRKIRFFVRHW